MSKHILTDSTDCPIKPSDINVDFKKGFRHLYGAFDNSETEKSAYWIVRLCQQLGSWGPFTLEQIQELYNESIPGEKFTFNRLVDPQAVFANPAQEFGRMAQHASYTRGMNPVAASISYAMTAAANPAPTVLKGGGWIVRHTDGKYYITDDFVSRCHQSSPASRAKQEPVAS